MAKKLSVIEKIEQSLQKHLEGMESLFPMEMSFTIIGRDVEGLGCEFVIGADDLSEVAAIIERSIKRQEDGEKPKKVKAKKNS